MKRLNEISLQQFIDVNCGIYDCLGCSDHKEAEQQAVKLIFEYKNIVNPGGVKAVLLEKEDQVKLRSKILMFKLCSALCKLGFTDEAKSVMLEYIPSYNKDGEEMAKDVSNRERESRFVYKRMVDNVEAPTIPTEDEIRASYDSEIAFVMTYFKMPLEVSKISASVYANIVAQAYREMKNRMSRKGT